MEDIILKKFFELDRWKNAIDHCIDKNCDKAVMNQLLEGEMLQKMLKRVAAGKYCIAPPHIAEIPKDELDSEGKMKMREVYVNFPEHRVFLNVANDLLFELTPEKIHPSCKSYQKGIGCTKVVMSLSRHIKNAKGDVFGVKLDISKYFDSVPIDKIMEKFDMVENQYGKSAVIDVLRRYYLSDLYFDLDGRLQRKDQSLKQGCSVASWLADVMLYHIDEWCSNKRGIYVRYSDDILYVGEDYEEVLGYIETELRKMGMKLNPDKVERLCKGKWFKFLGFMLKDDLRTIHKKSLKAFVSEISSRTIKSGKPYESCLKSVLRYLYIGDGKHSWASQKLAVLNVKQDIDAMNGYVMDCLRAVRTGKKHIGGIGFSPTQSHCLQRGKGRNVKANRLKYPMLDDFKSLGCMQKAMSFSHDLYKTMILEMK